jgi:hypothetical protein
MAIRWTVAKIAHDAAEPAALLTILTTILMTDWREHLTPDEAKRVDELDDTKRAIIKERKLIHNRAKQRRHRSDT